MSITLAGYSFEAVVLPVCALACVRVLWSPWWAGRFHLKRYAYTWACLNITWFVGLLFFVPIGFVRLAFQFPVGHEEHLLIPCAASILAILIFQRNSLSEFLQILRSRKLSDKSIAVKSAVRIAFEGLLIFVFLSGIEFLGVWRSGRLSLIGGPHRLWPLVAISLALSVFYVFSSLLGKRQGKV